eukprot:COSAG02_NODE_40946_length_401_cov_2.656667_1_plen_67_part_01
MGFQAPGISEMNSRSTPPCDAPTCGTLYDRLGGGARARAVHGLLCTAHRRAGVRMRARRARHDAERT